MSRQATRPTTESLPRLIAARQLIEDHYPLIRGVIARSLRRRGIRGEDLDERIAEALCVLWERVRSMSLRTQVPDLKAVLGRARYAVLRRIVPTLPVVDGLDLDLLTQEG